MNTIREKCPIIKFNDLGDERGKLVVVEGGASVPFDIKRVFYIYGSDTTVVRGQHANRESEFVLINVAGDSKVRITDGNEEMIVNLDKPMTGVYIPKMMWKDMYDFSEDSVLLVLASTHYNGEEYIRDYKQYLEEMNLKQMGKYLSLCIPTNGVSEWVFPVLDSIYSQGVSETLYEVVITDNGNNAEFKEKMLAFCKQKTNIIYKNTNAKGFLNEIEAYHNANGALIKFVNHRTKLINGTIEKLIKFAKENVDEKPIVYFSNGVINNIKDINEFTNFDMFVRKLSYWSSWSTGMAIWRDDIDLLPTNLCYYNELFPHTDILFNQRDRGRYIIDNTIMFEEIPQGKKSKGQYDVFYAFGVEYPSLILNLYRNGDITAETCRLVLKENRRFTGSIYLLFNILKLYCSYDLSGLSNIYSIFYTKCDIIRESFNAGIDIIMTKIKKIVKK